MYIKNSCKAIIIKNGRILLNKCRNDDGNLYYVLPGGGQMCGETMEEAVVRECYEETGCRVRVIRPAAYGERMYGGRHKLYHVFLCSLEEYTNGDPKNPDVNQIGCVWVDLKDGPRFYPSFIRMRLGEILAGEDIIYLGAEKNETPIIHRGKITLKYLQEYISSKENKNYCDKAYDKTYIEKIIKSTGELKRTADGDPDSSPKENIAGELFNAMYNIISLANFYKIDFEDIVPEKENEINGLNFPGLKFDPEEWSLLR